MKWRSEKLACDVKEDGMVECSAEARRNKKAASGNTLLTELNFAHTFSLRWKERSCVFLYSREHFIGQHFSQYLNTNGKKKEEKCTGTGMWNFPCRKVHAALKTTLL